MRLVLFRHGHKQFSMDNDPSLSEKGFIQADHLLKLVEKKILPSPTQCWFSDRKRTADTLSAFKQKEKILWLKKSFLTERHINEDIEQFRSRIKNTFNELIQIKNKTKNQEVIFMCSHYDWIEEALTLIPSDSNLTSLEFSNWAPGQYIEFEYFDDLFHFCSKGVL